MRYRFRTAQGNEVNFISPSYTTSDSQQVRTQHAHAPTPSSCRRWPPTSLDSTDGRPYGHEATTNVQGTPSAATTQVSGATPRPVSGGGLIIVFYPGCPLVFPSTRLPCVRRVVPPTIHQKPRPEPSRQWGLRLGLEID